MKIKHFLLREILAFCSYIKNNTPTTNRQPERSNLMVDYYEGEEVSNRLVADDEEEERDNVVAL